MIRLPVKRNILLNPGPATTTDTVKIAMVVPDICPREQDFTNLLSEVCEDLVKIVKGGEDYVCLVFGGSGTAVMDSCLNSVVPPGKKILVINNGAYGQRMVDIAKAYNISCVDVKFDPHVAIELSHVEQATAEDPQIACVAMVHHETTTGMLNPIKEIGEIAKNHRKVFIVDAISSFAGIPIDAKELGVDYLISTANKCLQGMAGASFVIARISELAKLHAFPKRSYYLDLYNQYEFFRETTQVPFTPPVQVIYSLKQALKEYFEEGGENRFRRYLESSRVLRAGLEKIGFRLLLDKKLQSPFLVTVIEPSDENYSFQTLHDLLYAMGFTIYPGKLHIVHTFRVANIGAIDKSDIHGFLTALRTVLVKMNMVVGQNRYR